MAIVLWYVYVETCGRGVPGPRDVGGGGCPMKYTIPVVYGPRIPVRPTVLSCCHVVMLVELCCLPRFIRSS